jgi:hypothetical protein
MTGLILLIGLLLVLLLPFHTPSAPVSSIAALVHLRCCRSTFHPGADFI